MDKTINAHCIDPLWYKNINTNLFIAFQILEVDFMTPADSHRNPSLSKSILFKAEAFICALARTPSSGVHNTNL